MELQGEGLSRLPSESEDVESEGEMLPSECEGEGLAGEMRASESEDEELEGEVLPSDSEFRCDIVDEIIVVMSGMDVTLSLCKGNDAKM